jgi:hypothetical protein
MLSQFFYQVGPDKKSYNFCVYYFDSLKIYTGIDGRDSFISLPHQK